jgi:hypothetical protein
MEEGMMFCKLAVEGGEGGGQFSVNITDLGGFIKDEYYS